MDKLICSRCECPIEELETGELVSGSDGSYYVHKDEMVCDSLGYEKTLAEQLATEEKEALRNITITLMEYPHLYRLTINGEEVVDAAYSMAKRIIYLTK